MSARRAPKISAVTSGLCQYPSATLGPDTQISPTWSAATRVRVVGSTMTTSCPAIACPQPILVSSSSPVPAGRIVFAASAPACRRRVTGSVVRFPPQTISVASARP